MRGLVNGQTTMWCSAVAIIGAWIPWCSALDEIIFTAWRLFRHKALQEMVTVGRSISRGLNLVGVVEGNPA